MIVIPAGINTLMTALDRRGHSVYAVGGCVRDSLLGRAPGDWDCATSALPDEIRGVLGGEITGGKYGTVTVEGVQFTPFRREGKYTDHRRPDFVEFVPDLETDLQRRDFTINAMAADIGGRITDPFGGQVDLKDKIIRCVGDPFTRFEEDALRILRALRFAHMLGFSIENETRRAMVAHAGTLSHLTKKVIIDEAIRLISSLDFV
jgi:tRNA nucleotidyltransferase (CCA-adding enzyme)